MYYNHNLRTSLQEWKVRLVKANVEHYASQLKFLINNLENNKLLFGLIQESIMKYSYPNSDEYFENILKSDFKPEINFENQMHRASLSYQLLKYAIMESKSYSLFGYYGGSFDVAKEKSIEFFITPIIYYLHDKLDESNSILFLLEKYKKRTEWFTYIELKAKYETAIKSYEEIFENDLRLFLFDQGIDYPFSTPKSTSGRADIIGSIETDNPIVIEIKIFDKEKNYGKNRIIDGFSQIIKYTNDYNKEIGYLIVFNMNNLEIEFELNDKNNNFPPMIHFSNKTYFIIIVNLFNDVSASKQGKTEKVTINENELTAIVD